MATRWPAAVIAATGTSAITSAARDVRSPAIASPIAAASASSVDLDRHERAEERREAEPRGAPRAAAPPRGAATAACPRPAASPASTRATCTSARLALAPAARARRSAARAWSSRRASPSRRRRGCRARSAAPPRSRSGRAGRGRSPPASASAPAGELAVGAVEQELQLDQHHGAERGRRARAASSSAPRPASPPAIISHVTPFGVIGVRSSSRVRYGDTRRMYSRPAQCSPLLRAKIEAGWVAARSSAIDGARRTRRTRAPRLPPRRGRGARGSCSGPAAWPARARRPAANCVVGEPEVGGHARQPVAAQAGVEPRGQRRRRRAGSAVNSAAAPASSPWCAVPGKQVVDRVEDLVVGAAARAARAGDGHRQAGQHERLGERDRGRRRRRCRRSRSQDRHRRRCGRTSPRRRRPPRRARARPAASRRSPTRLEIASPMPDAAHRRLAAAHVVEVDDDGDRHLHAVGALAPAVLERGDRRGEAVVGEAAWPPRPSAARLSDAAYLATSSVRPPPMPTSAS